MYDLCSYDEFTFRKYQNLSVAPLVRVDTHMIVNVDWLAASIVSFSSRVAVSITTLRVY